MYLVSNDFKTAMKKAQRVEHVRGYVGSIPFTDNNIISLTYSNRCSDTKDVTFGSAYIGQVEVQFVNLLIARGSWQGQVITLEYGLTLADDSVEYIPVGVFTVAEAEWSDIGVKVTAYDNMSKLDRPFSVSAMTGTLYDYLNYVCVQTGLSVGRSAVEMSGLPNGNAILSLYENNDITTYRDLVSWVACSLGGFAFADRNGNLSVKSWSEASVVDNLVAKDRISGSVFSDFETLYDGISIIDMTTGATVYYSENAGVGASIALGSNPLLQYGTDVVKDSQRQALAAVANGIAYTPFNMSLLNCPVYDFADLITCSGGVAGTGSLTVCVMSVDWNFKNTINLQGFGADPNLSSGKSRTDKALNGLKSKTSENELTIHTFENAQAHVLSDQVEQNVIEIYFATMKPKKVTMWHEINLDVTLSDPTMTVQVLYYLNDDLIAYSPVETYDEDGEHILSLMYFLDTLSGGMSCDWRVNLICDGGSATIDVGDIHAILMGQGLVAIDDFDGSIVVEDTFTPIEPNNEVTPITDDPAPDFEFVSVADVRVTEDQTDTRVTENGDIRITE